MEKAKETIKEIIKPLTESLANWIALIQGKKDNPVQPSKKIRMYKDGKPVNVLKIDGKKVWQEGRLVSQDLKLFKTKL